MSKLVVLSVKDSAVRMYAQPMFMPTHLMAIRAFADAVNADDPQSNLCRHPDDFELVELAEFDDETGAFTNLSPRTIARGKDLVRRAGQGVPEPLQHVESVPRPEQYVSRKPEGREVDGKLFREVQNYQSNLMSGNQG